MTGLSFIKHHKGFTLVEVLTVMLVLVAIASVTIEMSSELAYQNRYEITKDRYEKIKRAIIGRPDVLINGQPDISGFVADMGRLPLNIHDLLEEEYCLTDRTISDSGTCGAGWRIQTTKNTVNGLSFGWNGPYLSISKEPKEANAFPDGWGRNAQGYCSNLLTNDPDSCPDNTQADWVGSNADHNYGWYSNELSTGNFTLISHGKDQIFGGTPPDYDSDFPFAQQEIKNYDWKVDINEIEAEFLSSSSIGSCSISAPNNSGSCIMMGGSWTTSICTINSSEQNLCEIGNGTWIIGPTTQCQLFYSDQADCTARGGTPVAGTNCTGYASPVSKTSCESILGGVWSPIQPAVFMKISYRSIDGTGQTVISELVSSTVQIEENGWKNIKTFSGFFNDANNNGVRDVATEDIITEIPLGAVSIGIYEYGTNHFSGRAYPKVCENSNDDANFQTNCIGGANKGSWFDDGTEQYCYGLIDEDACTGSVSPQLNGSFRFLNNKEEIKLQLRPKATLPMISW